VYCQMHYSVDAIAGLLVGGLVTWAVGRGRGEDRVSGVKKGVSGNQQPAVGERES
jgi:outer membrane lipoprotein SlyB